MIIEFDSKRVKTFESYVLCFAIVQVLHLISLIANLNTPLGLLYGPLLYCMYTLLIHQHNTSIRGFVFQSFPFVLFFIWYLLTYFLPSTSYFVWIFPLMVISSLIYCVLVFLKMRRYSHMQNNEFVLLIKQLSVLGITIAFFLFLFYVDQFLQINLRIETIFTLSVSMFFCVFIALHFLYLQWNDRRKKNRIPANELQLAMDPVMVTYGEKLEKAMAQDELFLDANLSLGQLSEITAIPKHNISDFLNHYQNVSYYEWLAKYRIEYALNFMESSKQELKMEAVATASGFNSKTVFYRYFKLYVGESPSVYRAKLIGS